MESLPLMAFFSCYRPGKKEKRKGKGEKEKEKRREKKREEKEKTLFQVKANSSSKGAGVPDILHPHFGKLEHFRPPMPPICLQQDHLLLTVALKLLDSAPTGFDVCGRLRIALLMLDPFDSAVLLNVRTYVFCYDTA